MGAYGEDDDGEVKAAAFCAGDNAGPVVCDGEAAEDGEEDVDKRNDDCEDEDADDDFAGL